MRNALTKMASGSTSSHLERATSPPGGDPAAPTPSSDRGRPARPQAAPSATRTSPQTRRLQPRRQPEQPPKTLEELLAELDALVGLTAVKGEIHRQVAVLRIEAKREAAGLKVPTITRHLVFVGNPGTGKTTVARLVAGIYRALGLLTKGQLVEVDRSELVAGYLGQTAMKTADVVKAPSAACSSSTRPTAWPATSTAPRRSTRSSRRWRTAAHDLVVIVAGYPEPMAYFIAQNPGLASRFRTTIEFVDYTDDELVGIFKVLATGADYDISAEVGEAVPRDARLGAAADRRSATAATRATCSRPRSASTPGGCARSTSRPSSSCAR